MPQGAKGAFPEHRVAVPHSSGRWSRRARLRRDAGVSEFFRCACNVSAHSLNPRTSIASLSAEVATRVAIAIDRLSQNPRPPGCLLLRNYEPPTWRIRVGAWRILYEIDDRARLVRIRNVHHRSKAY